MGIDKVGIDKVGIDEVGRYKLTEIAKGLLQSISLQILSIEGM